MLKLNTQLDALISIEVSEEESVNRLLNRGITSGRSDDNETVIRNRLREYHDKTLPVLNFFKEKGAFTVEADGKYRVNFDKMKSATKELVNVLITTEGDGDYARATEMIKTQGFIPEELQESLNKINSSNIPVDIRYNQGLEVLGLNH